MQSLKLFICFVLVFGTISVSNTKELNDHDKANIERVVMGYADAVNRNNYDVVVARVPQEVRQAIAEYSLMDKSAINGVLARELELQHSIMQISDMTIDFSQIQYGSLNSEIPYFKVPVVYQFVDSTGKVVKATTELFGILKEGAWYMVRTDDDFIFNLWQQQFPNMKNIEIKEPTYTILPTPPVND
ncbi:hypothetical protein [Bartonella apis]|uniref:hypothetical protein n=1 Tax=Bartonella apis TaxID=1686310 RepID=UPI00242B0208|nr:hypothetical protein [Bartonella apis]